MYQETEWGLKALFEGKGETRERELLLSNCDYARDRGLAAEFVAGNVLEMELPSADVAVVFDTLFCVQDQARIIDILAAKVDWLVISNINTFE